MGFVKDHESEKLCEFKKVHKFEKKGLWIGKNLNLKYIHGFGKYTNLKRVNGIFLKIVYPTKFMNMKTFMDLKKVP